MPPSFLLGRKATIFLHGPRPVSNVREGRFGSFIFPLLFLNVLLLQCVFRRCVIVQLK